MPPAFVDLLILAAYLGAVVYVGLLGARRRRSGMEDFILAGRTLTLPMFVATLVTTFYGGILGVGEFAWSFGVVNWLAQGVPYYLFGAVYAFWLAGRVRLTPGLTIPDHLEAVYGRGLAVFAALLLFLMMNPADEILMLGTIVRWVTGFDLRLCMAASAVVGLVYIWRGGLRADVWTNELQFVFLFGGFFLILPFAWAKLGGLDWLAANLPPAHLTPLGGKPAGYLLAWYLIALWTLIDPAFHQRAAAARDPATARKGILVSIAFWCLFDGMTTLAGLYARALMPDLAEPMMAFPLLADRLLPPLVRGLFVAGLMSSMLASLDGAVLISAVSLAKDAAGRWTGAPEEVQENWVKGAVVLSGAAGFLMALWMPSVVQLWYAIGSTVNPGLLLPLISVYFPWLRVPPEWAMASAVGGWGLSTVWFLWGQASGAAPMGVEPMYPGLALAVLLWTAGMLRRPRPAAAAAALGALLLVSTGPSEARVYSAGRRESIFIIGVAHAPEQFRSDGFSPAHVRAALEAINPDVVGVESNPAWFEKGQFYRQTYEAQHLAVPWARERGIPLYGIDWIGDLGPDKDYAERERLEQVRLMRAALDKTDLDPGDFEYGSWAWPRPSTAPPTGEETFLFLNGKEYARRTLDWIDAGREESGSAAEYMDLRDANIAASIAEVVLKHPGNRFAIVIGAMHKADLERRLEERSLRVVTLPTVLRGLPLADGPAMDGRLTIKDIAAILSEAWDSGEEGTGRARAERLLERLKAAAGTQEEKAWLAYFTARKAMLDGDSPGAHDGFQTLVSSGSGVRFPFRGSLWRQHLTLDQAALLELGRMADLEGKRKEALEAYRGLSAALNVPPYSEDYHSDYLYLATAKNAVRALLDSPFRPRRGGQAQLAAPAAEPVEAPGLAEVRRLYWAGKHAEALQAVAKLQASAAISSHEADLQRAWVYFHMKQDEQALVVIGRVLETPFIPALEKAEAAMLELMTLKRLDRRDAFAKKREAFKKEHLPAAPPDHWLRREFKSLDVNGDVKR